MKNTTIFAIMAFMVLALVASASAIVAGPADVTGTVYEHDGVTPVSGATVTVTCNSITPASVLTDSNGAYMVIFDSGCGYNTPVTVSAVKGSASGTNNGVTCMSSEDCEIPVALVDVSIPEFGVIAGAIALLAGIGIVAYRRN